MMNLICPMDLILFFDIQDCFEYIIKKHETIIDTDNPPVEIDVNEIKKQDCF